jgi:hypothetical protein
MHTRYLTNSTLRIPLRTPFNEVGYRIKMMFLRPLFVMAMAILANGQALRRRHRRRNANIHNVDTWFSPHEEEDRLLAEETANFGWERMLDGGMSMSMSMPSGEVPIDTFGVFHLNVLRVQGGLGEVLNLVTIPFFDDFLTEAFKNVPETTYLGVVISPGFSFSFFQLSDGAEFFHINNVALFDPASSAIPSTAQLNNFVQMALEENSPNYVARCQNDLPPRNPFTNTTSISYIPV